MPVKHGSFAAKDKHTPAGNPFFPRFGPPGSVSGEGTVPERGILRLVRNGKGVTKH